MAKTLAVAKELNEDRADKTGPVPLSPRGAGRPEEQGLTGGAPRRPHSSLRTRAALR